MPFTLASAATLVGLAGLLVGTPAPTDPATPTPGPDPASVTSGPVALVVLLALLAAVVVLWRSLNKQLRRVDFDETATTDEGRMRRHDDGRDQPGG